MNRVSIADAQNLSHHTAGISYTRGFTRNSSFRLGYAYQDGAYGSGTDPSTLNRGNHNINVGLDYARALSPWRRTKVTFGSGSSLARRLDTAQDPAASSDHPLTLYITGFAAISRELGRSWNVRGTYTRSMSYVPGFADPFFSDGVSLWSAGALGRRTSVSAQLSGSRGSVGLAPSGTSASDFGNNFWAYTATARAQYAITRHIAAFANYVYYNYAFGGAVSLPTDLLRATGRQSIQAGLTTLLPILRR
jgi:hypothetical protein